MNSLEYEIILKLYDLRSVTKTAEYFNYTPSRISQILKNTEETYGLPLFHRIKGRFIPTMECECLRPILLSILSGEHCLQEQINQLKHTQCGTIRIGSFTSISCHWLPQHLKEFEKLYPKIHFDLRLGDSTQIASWVRNGITDMGLATDPASEDLQFTNLMEDSFSVVLPKSHPLSACSAVSYEQLREEKFIFLEPEDNELIEAQLHRDGFYPNVQYRVKDDYTIMSLVENNLGISILPDLVLNRSPYNICTVGIHPPCTRKIGIILMKSDHISPAISCFLDFLQSISTPKDIDVTG